MPELRFTLGEPAVDTTSADNAVFALGDKSYFIRRVGSDGFKIGHQATMKKVVSDRRAFLDEESETLPAVRAFVLKEFDRGRTIPIVPFPADGAAVQDTPRLTPVVLDPESEWTSACDATGGKGSGSLREQIAEWMRQRGKSPRIYPGSLVWCLKKPGRDLREKVELWPAWKRVNKEIAEGTLGGEFSSADRADIVTKVSDAEEAAKDEVWGGYRFAVLADHQEPDGLRTIDLGAGHSSGSETLCGRVITALKSQALLNESVGAGYIERNWPPALKETGAWPLASLRQSFLNGSLTRLLDPDAVLRVKIVEFVSKGDFGLACGNPPASVAPNTSQAGAARKTGEPGSGGYDRVWFHEPITPDEVSFEHGVFLLWRTWAYPGECGSSNRHISLHPPVFSLFQQGDDLAIGRRQGKVVELPGKDPPVIVDPDEPDAAAPVAALEGVEGDPEVGVGVLHRCEPRADPDADPQLFPDFPLQAALQRLPRFLLPPGELPEPPQQTLRRPARDEKTGAPPDDSRRDLMVGNRFPG